MPRLHRSVQDLVLACQYPGARDEPARRIHVVEAPSPGAHAPPLVEHLEVLESERGRADRPLKVAAVPRPVAVRGLSAEPREARVPSRHRPALGARARALVTPHGLALELKPFEPVVPRGLE